MEQTSVMTVLQVRYCRMYWYVFVVAGHAAADSYLLQTHAVVVLSSHLKDALRLWQIASRDQTTVEKEKVAVDATSYRLSLPSLFLLLEAVSTLDGAEGIELMIKDTFKCHQHEGCQRQLEKGLTEMMRGNHDEALQLFISLVEGDSEYAEGWNWLATCEYLRGKHAASITAAGKALKLQPMNFQTQSGIGLCLYDMGKYEESAAAFRLCLDLDPWSPVSTRLSACIDILNRRGGKEEEEE
jgi:tetratricopeptide (TPR) repeat protein